MLFFREREAKKPLKCYRNSFQESYYPYIYSLKFNRPESHLAMVLHYCIKINCPPISRRPKRHPLYQCQIQLQVGTFFNQSEFIWWVELSCSNSYQQLYITRNPKCTTIPIKYTMMIQENILCHEDFQPDRHTAFNIKS